MMRVWICLLAAGALVVMSASGFAQRTSRPTTGGGGQGGTRTDTGEAGQGRTGAGGGGLGVGDSAGDNLTDPDSVFGIDRGGNIGATADTARGFSTVGGEGNAATGRGAFGGAFGGGLGGLGGLFGGAGGFGNMQQQEPATQIRTRLRADIDVQRVSTPQVESRIQSRLAKLPSKPRFRGVNVEMRGRTAVLMGAVESSEDRRMAELLIRLEPGVSSIENQLLISDEVLENSAAPPVEIPAPQANEAPVQ